MRKAKGVNKNEYYIEALIGQKWLAEIILAIFYLVCSWNISFFSRIFRY